MPGVSGWQADCSLPPTLPLQLSRFIDSAAEIAAEAQGLMRALRVPPEDMRGVGITVPLQLLGQPRQSSVAVRPSGNRPVQAHVLITLHAPCEHC